MSYLYYALKCTQTEPDNQLLLIVLVNVLIAEVFFWIGYHYITFSESFSVLNLVGFVILQDAWFYATHRMLHSNSFLYQFHKLHHTVYSPVYAWLAHPIDHIVVNLGSVAVPFMICDNPYWVLVLLCALECHTSVTGHADGTPHHTHHKNVTKRLGSIYLFDRLLGSY